VENNVSALDKHKVIIISVVFTVITAACIFLFFILKNKEVEFDLSPYNSEIPKLFVDLESQEIPYKHNEESGLLVVNEVDNLRVQSLLTTNKSKFERIGFEIFDVQEYGVSDFRQKVSLVRALQGELEKTILAMDGVVEARVHLVVNNSKFQRKRGETGRASVYLKLSDSANGDVKRNVIDLVAYSVPNLKEENIKIISNQAGNLGSLADYPILHHKVRVENYYRDKVTGVVSSLYPVDMFVVNVDVQVSSEQFNSKSEKVLALNGSGVAVSKKERTDEKHQGQGKDKQKNTKKDIEYQYRTGTTIENVSRLPFSIERKSIAILILKKVEDSDLTILKSVIAASTGINEKSGDTMIIKSISKD
jgi:Flagellar biosynthesis/type III secretory pathway lipoprotein